MTAGTPLPYMPATTVHEAPGPDPEILPLAELDPVILPLAVVNHDPAQEPGVVGNNQDSRRYPLCARYVP